MKGLAIEIVLTQLISLPCVAQGVVSLGINSDTGREEIRVNLPALPRDAKPLDMVLIPAGTFVMGSPENEAGRRDHEGPQHRVTLTNDFYVGKYEVTQAQWDAVMASKPYEFCGRPDNPVENVSWQDCQSFVDSLNEIETLSGGFRLPRDAEWEYVCRAGTITRFYWGDDPDYSDIGDYAWYNSNSNSQTHAVGQKIPNAWGLYDMSGNVYEWCADGPREYSTASQVDPVGSATSSVHALRGGGWYQAGYYCRSAFNHRYGSTHSYIGFRLARTVGGDSLPTARPTPAPTDTPTPTHIPTASIGARVLLINVRGSPLKHSDDAHNLYETLLLAGAEGTFVDLDQEGEVESLIRQNEFDQIWLFDLSSEDDHYPQDWEAIAQWYNLDAKREIICDGRILASYRAGGFENEGRRLTENYFQNLKIRGGGLLLGTDDDDYHSGIKSVNELIGLGPFTDVFNTSVMPIDKENPLMLIPNDMGESLINDSSPGRAPSGLQPNGRMLSVVGWHPGDPDVPGITSTIGTETSTPTNTRTSKATPTVTPTISPTNTQSPTFTPTRTPTPSATPTVTPTEFKPTATATFTPVIRIRCTNDFSLRTDHVIHVGPQPVGILRGDFNEDGNIDLVVADSAEESIRLLFGTGQYPYFRCSNIDLGMEIEFISCGDINHDGHLDIAVLSYVHEQLLVLAGEGNGEFTQDRLIPVEFFLTEDMPTTGRIQPLTIGDVNEDGLDDMLLAIPSNGFLTTLVAYLSDALDDNAQVTISPNLVNQQEIQFIEIVGDRIFVGAGGLSPEIIVLSNEKRDFSEVCRITTQDTIPRNNVNGFRKGDADRDGDSDMIIAPFDNTVRLLVGDEVPYSQRIGDLVEKVLIDDVLIVDLDGDDCADLLYANRETGADGVQSISVVCGLSIGKFTDAATFRTTRPTSPFTRLSLQLGDVNRDGREDVILLDPLASEIVIFLNESRTTDVEEFALY